MSKFEGLEKILGKGKGMVSRVVKESGEMGGAIKDAGKGAAASIRHGQGEFGHTLKNLGVDAKVLGGKAKANPFGAAVLGAGGAAATGGAGMGIKELLASLEDDGDEDDMPKRRRR